jgi:hypothetical protein
MTRRIRLLTFALLASVALGASACTDAAGPEVCAESGAQGSGTFNSGAQGSGTFCQSSGAQGSGT